MGENVDDWIERQRDNDVPDQRIRNQLRDSGYSKEQIDDLLQEDGFSLHSKALLALTGLLTLLYIPLLTGNAVSLATIEESGLNLILSGFALTAAAIGLLNLGAGLNYLRKRDLRPGLISLGHGLLTTGILGSIVLIVPRAFQQTGPAPTNVEAGVLIQFLGYGPFLLLLAAAIVTAAFTWERWGTATLAVPLLVLVIFIGGFGSHYLSTTGTAEKIPDPSYQNPEIGTITEGNFRHLLTASAAIPPPAGPLMTEMAAISHVSSIYATWTQYQDDWNRPAAGSTQTCGGTTENFNDRYGQDPGPLMTAMLHHKVIQDLDKNRDGFKASIRSYCGNIAERCYLDEESLESDIETFLSELETHRDLIQEITGTKKQEYPDLVVSKDCGSSPDERYQIELTDLHCGTDEVRATLSSDGQPLNTIIDLQVRNNFGEINYSMSKTAIREPDDWQGKIDISRDVRLQENDIYIIRFLTVDGIELSAYCKGGNGFCTGCQDRQREHVEAIGASCTATDSGTDVTMTINNTGIEPLDMSESWHYKLDISEDGQTIHERSSDDLVTTGLNDDHITYEDFGVHPNSTLSAGETRKLAFTTDSLDAGSYTIDLGLYKQLPDTPVRDQHQIHQFTTTCEIED